MDNARILTSGDSAVTIEFGNEISPEINRRISTVVKIIRSQNIEGIRDMIPAFCSLLISYDPRIISYKKLTDRLRPILHAEVSDEEAPRRVFEIPTCYGGELGPDLPFVAEHAGLTEQEVVKLHAGRDYLIYMLGFLPGFTYLGGLDQRLFTPRLATPRLVIPAGSVGIGGQQTGIYPLDSPGGWQLIGKTPVRTYDPDREPPILVSAGDYIRFVPVSPREYEEIEDLVNRGCYTVTVREGGE